MYPLNLGRTPVTDRGGNADGVGRQCVVAFGGHDNDTSRLYQLLRWQRMQDGYALTLCAPPYCSPDPGDSRNYFGQNRVASASPVRTPRGHTGSQGDPCSVRGRVGVLHPMICSGVACRLPPLPCGCFGWIRSPRREGRLHAAHTEYLQGYTQLERADMLPPQNTL